MSYAVFFSILFFSVSIIVMVSGILVLQYNAKSATNRCFFALVLAVDLWSIGLAFATIAPDVETAIIWRRIAAVGWGSVYAIALHFFLLITGNISIIKRKWQYAILYAPVVMCMLAFVIPNALNPEPYHLKKAVFGWINVTGTSNRNIWDWLFNLYYIGYVTVGLVLLVRWGYRSRDRKIKLQARSLFLSFAVALVLATFTDVILGNLFAKTPQMAPVILLIPIVTMYNIMVKYDFIISRPAEKRASYIRVITGIIVYLFLLFVQFYLVRYVPKGFSSVLDAASLRGIVTQIQMFLSIYLVLREKRPGYLAAFLINLVGLGGSILAMFGERGTEPLPGTISYLGVLLVVVLIHTYHMNTDQYIRTINNQNDDLERSENELYKRVYFDALTGLHNREWFVSHLDQTIKEVRQDRILLAVIFIDLDSFKSINDTRGHSVGDEILRLVANRLASVLRQKDVMARFGGDEFLIMVSNVDSLTSLRRITERIMNVFRSPIEYDSTDFFVTASVGVAVYPQDGDDSETLIKNADIAMYLAKNTGKNQCVYCTPEIKYETTHMIRLTNALHRAIDNAEISVHFQPQIQAGTLEVSGFEALLRWENQTFGRVRPDVFIPIAEQTGLIRPIGLWVFRQACEVVVSFQAHFEKAFTMSVNLSLVQLKDDDLAERFSQIMAETGVQPKDMQIEITESIAFSHDAHILKQIESLKQLGLAIAIDDFGTGFSSFVRLKSFPVDILKIDIDFVHGISSGSEKDLAIVGSIIHIAQSLGIDIVAEGVETSDQFIHLRDHGCHFIQGFYFYKPMAADVLQETLKEHHCKASIEAGSPWLRVDDYD